MKNFEKQFLHVAVLGLIVVAQTGCQATITGETENTWHCIAFQPITWSSKDTAETLKQVREHNAVWDSLCGES